MNRWYVGDGISGFRRWLFARCLWRLPWRILRRLDPGLPEGWYWNYRVDGHGFYARHDS